jgi:2Fe-2S ferredoxin
VPVVVIEPKRGGTAASVEADVPDGGALVDVCDELRAPVPFSCKSANCGTCRVEVLEGAEELAPPSKEEQELLAILRAPAQVRLACRAQIKPGRPGLRRLRIRPVDDEA